MKKYELTTMDNLTLAIEILKRCETEKKRLEEYEKEYAEVEKAWEGFTWKKWNEVYNKYKPIPKKTQINSGIKCARKLLVESYIK